MNFKDRLKNNFLYGNMYRTHSEAIVIACYFNPQNNPYRLSAFRTFYNSIKHLNHQIVECVIGDSKPELVNEFPSLSISRVFTKNLLWHKETLLNDIVSKLSPEYKYVFWLDADVIFTNKHWLVDGVNALHFNNIVQPFEYCVHMEKDELVPSFDIDSQKFNSFNVTKRHPKMWRSFSANHVMGISNDDNYDMHGHVGFAWGARREVLDSVPLYDKALIGGADHIIAHAAAGHFGHSCIAKSFTDDIDSVNDWSKKFYNVVKGKIGYVKGNLLHIWHGDLSKRQYLKRIQDFTKTAKDITTKDKNGLYITDDDSYVKQYYEHREVSNIKSVKPQTKIIDKQHIEAKRQEYQSQYPGSDDSFIESLLIAYITDSTAMGMIFGGDIAGAMIGDMLNTSDNVDLGGGNFGGGGSGGTWEDNNEQSTDSTQVNVDVPISDNFS